MSADPVFHVSAQVVHPASLSVGYGCGGERVEAYLLSERPLSSLDLAALRHSVLDEGRVRTELERCSPLPPAPVWGPSWESRGAYESARTAHSSLRQAREHLVEESLPAALVAAYRSEGLVPFNPVGAWPDAALFVLDSYEERGCRCSYSHSRTPSPPGGTSPALLLSSPAGRHLLAADLLSGASLPPAVVSALDGSDGVVSAALEAYRVEAEPYLSFVPLPEEEEQALSFSEWERYDALKKERTSWGSARLRVPLAERYSQLRDEHLARVGLLAVVLDEFPSEEPW